MTSFDGGLVLAVDGAPSESVCVDKPAVSSSSAVTIRRRSALDPPLYLRISADLVETDHNLDRLAESDDFQPSIDARSLLHFLWRGRPEPGRTLYSDIRVLDVGYELVCLWGHPPITRRIPWALHVESADGDEQSLAAEALRRVEIAVGSICAQNEINPGSTPQPALLLSGGVDSSLLAAVLQSRKIFPTCYTVEFEERYRLNETRYAASVANHLRLRHEIVRIHSKAASSIMRKILDAPEPCAAPASITHVALAEAAHAQGHKAIMSGLGADECFGGYHKPLMSLAVQMRRMAKKEMSLRELYDSPYSDLKRCRDLIFYGVAEFFSISEVMEFAKDKKLMRNFGIPDIELYRSIVASKPCAFPTELMAVHEYHHRVAELLIPALTRWQINLPFSFIFPYLSEKLFWWAASLEPGHLYRHKEGDWRAKPLLRSAASQRLPAAVVWRKRQVLLAPVGHWLADEAFRRRIIEEVADSNLWRMGIVSKNLRDSSISRLQASEIVENNVWQEQLWILLVLCGWLNRRKF